MDWTAAAEIIQKPNNRMFFSIVVLEFEIILLFFLKIGIQQKLIG